MKSIFELKAELKECIARKSALRDLPKSEGRAMTDTERLDYQAAFAQEGELNGQILKLENDPNRSLARMFREQGPAAFMGDPAPVAPGSNPLLNAPEYQNALHTFLVSGGKHIMPELAMGQDGVGGFHIPGSEAFTRQRGPNGAVAASYEGTLGNSNAAGGYALSVPTVQQIIPLGMPDLGLLNASMVIETSNPVKLPRQETFGTSALKAESTGTATSFGGTDATLGSITLDAYMVGRVAIASWELLQDVEIFQQFLVDDLLRSQRIYEGQLFASGTGAANKQPTGVFGATGTGTGSAYPLVGTSADAATLLDSLFDVVGTLKSAYAPGASWVMSRATCLAIRRAQLQANLFAPVVTVDADGTTRILGWPVYFDQNAPALPTATTAGVPSILFGDFKQGVVIGLRGGSGINVKLLDQPLAMQGQLAILAYRRVDSMIRRSEAIQQISFSHQ